MSSILLAKVAIELTYYTTSLVTYYLYTSKSEASILYHKAAGSTIYSPRRLSLYQLSFSYTSYIRYLAERVSVYAKNYTGTSVDASGVKCTNGCNPS
ncbi:uncharacterized protein RAG0_13232 [Rhynchosporium agropyri]|uniref:Uncharacterized protein n=1 Tax=Rhynchosporium agropyri TaxID=914238 RepID=A0A1E1LC45_9HELO|nr:uncharacterized protein RAG0_13232 [Rhynchosporium agropyri]